MIAFLANDLFKPRVNANNILLVWEGHTKLQKKSFILFRIPFHVLLKDELATFILSICATASVARWTFPWSMFSPFPNTITFKREVAWRKQEPDSTASFFRVEPGESVSTFGDSAKDAVYAYTAGDIASEVRVIEIHEDDTYNSRSILVNPLAKSTREESKEQTGHNT